MALTSSFEVRRAELTDVEEIAAAHLDSIRSIGARYYERASLERLSIRRLTRTKTKRYAALEGSHVVFGLTLAVALLSGTGTAQAAHRPSSRCLGIEATLRVSPTAVKAGSRPAFTLVVKNRSEKPVRLLDARAGRRADLALSYYELVLEQNGRTLKNLTRVISDPGPITTADYFVLSPASAVEIPLSTTADLSTLRIGQYAAHVRITFDPLSTPVPSCQSARTSFRVR